MRKSKYLFFLILLLFTSLIRVKAEENVYTNPDTGYEAVLNDAYDLLSDGEERLLMQDMKKITAYGNCAFVSVYQHQSTSTYAKQIYREYFGTDSGTVFVIDMQNRIIYIFSDGKVYKTITKAYANTITDNVYKYATRKQYYECAHRVFEQELTLLEGGRIAQPMKYITNILIALIAAALINFCVLLNSRKDKEADTFAAGGVGVAAGLALAERTRSKMLSRKKKWRPESDGGSGGGSSGGGGGGGSSGGGGGHSF